MTRFDRIHVHLPILEPFANDPIEQRLGDRELVILDDDQAFIDALPEIEVLMAFRPPSGHWATAERLQLIQVPGAGVDAFTGIDDLADSVAVCNASGTHDPEMSEFIIAMLHAVTYNVPRLVDQQRAHQWRTPVTPGRSLEDGTMCILGLGTIGANVARRAAALGMNVVGVRHSGQPVDHVTTVVTPDRRLDVLAGASALVIITPLTEETRGIIGEAELAALEPGAVVVDVSRGGVMDIDALVQALESRHLFGAAVDVFETEPLPADSSLWDVENLLVTPHTASASVDYTRRIAEMFATNLHAFEQGRTPPGLVDRRLGY